MFSLRKFFSRDETFFDLIESLAESAASGVHTMAGTVAGQEQPKSVGEMAQIKRRSKDLNDKIAHELCVSFVTPFEREDIEALSSALMKISKTAEKFVSQYIVFKNVLPAGEFANQAEPLNGLAETIVKMVKILRKKPDVEAVRTLNEYLRAKETESDTFMLDTLQTMYAEADEQKLTALLAAKNLQELLEKLLDRFRDAGNVVFRIVLKYS